MKNLKAYLFLITVFVTSTVFGADTWFPEGIQVKTGSTFGAKATADSKAIVDMRSTTKGLLPPRMTTAQRSAIASPTEGLQVFDTDLNSMMSYTGSAWEELASLAGTETFTNKTHTDPIVSDAVRLSEQGSTPSTPASTFKKLYAKNDGKLYTLNSSGTETEVGAGSGEGGINYITNGKAETDTSGWSTYADAAATTPVDGTGGSPSSTWTRSTSSPMRGTASFLWTKSANNRQGEGTAFNFTIDRSDLGRQLAITGVYEIASGTYATGDLAFYVYDVTNATLIQPSGYQILNVGTQYEFVNVVFQAATNSSSYRLIVHTASTSASAYTVKFDNFGVGPLIKSFGVPYSDTTTYTPTLTTSGGGAITLNATGKVDPNGVYYRNGEYLHVQITAKNGSGGAASGSAGSAQFSLPSICTPNTAKLATAVGGVRVDGKGNVGTTTFLPAEVYISGSILMLMPSGFGSYLAVSNIAASYYMALEAKIPCVGWSGNTVTSDSAATRVVAVRATLTTAQTGVTDKVIPFNSVTTDTHGSFNSSTGVFTAVVPGVYRVQAKAAVSAMDGSTNAFLAIRKNSAEFGRGYGSNLPSATTLMQMSIVDTVSLVAGDTIDIYIDGDASFDIDNTSGRTTVSIDLIQGNQQISAADLIEATYTSDTGLSLSAGVAAIKPYEDKVTDTHSAYNTSTGVYTVPAPGRYLVMAGSCTGTTTFSINDEFAVIFRKNSTALYRDAHFNTYAGSTVICARGSHVINAVAGDTFDIQHMSDKNGTGTTGATRNHLHIVRLNSVQ